MVTLGAVPFSEIFSRSRDHWKRKLFVRFDLMTESQLTTKMRSRVTAVPLPLTDPLLCVTAVW